MFAMVDLPFHSPLEPLHDPVLDARNISLYVKRDDKIHPFISGNKWRKLKYLLEDARRLGKTHLVSFGGAYSNHLLALAAAAAQTGVKSTGIVRGEAAESLNDTLFVCRQFGMNIRYLDRDRYRTSKLAVFEELFGGDPAAYFIDEGGRSPLAAKGCAELVFELEEEYDHLFLACGTGCTMAGILQGLERRNSTTRAEGIAVLKDAAFLEKDIRELSGNQYPFRLHLDMHLGGYAKTTPSFLSWLTSFHQRHGLLLDPVYTGKMMYALFLLAERDYFSPGSRILAIHTGGLFGLLGMKERIISHTS